jgi:hypothetical protein
VVANDTKKDDESMNTGAWFLIDWFRWISALGPPVGGQGLNDDSAGRMVNDGGLAGDVLRLQVATVVPSADVEYNGLGLDRVCNVVP